MLNVSRGDSGRFSHLQETNQGHDGEGGNGVLVI